jgi:hypothetical protein
MKRIIILTIMILLLLPISLADRNIRVIEDIEDNDFLRIRGDNIDLDIEYLGYQIINHRETIVFNFDMDDYERRGNVNRRVRKTFEASIDTSVLQECLTKEDIEFCKNKYILSQNNDEGVRPILFQRNEEVNNIRNNINIQQEEIRENRNPIINFLNGLVNVFN